MHLQTTFKEKGTTWGSSEDDNEKSVARHHSSMPNSFFFLAYPLVLYMNLWFAFLPFCFLFLCWTSSTFAAKPWEEKNKKKKCKCYYVLCSFICLHYFTWCVKPYLCMCFFLIYTYIYPIFCRMKQPYTILLLHIHVQSHTFILEMYIYSWYHIYNRRLVMWCQNIYLFEKKVEKYIYKLFPLFCICHYMPLIGIVETL